MGYINHYLSFTPFQFFSDIFYKKNDSVQILTFVSCFTSQVTSGHWTNHGSGNNSVSLELEVYDDALFANVRYGEDEIKNMYSEMIKKWKRYISNKSYASNLEPALSLLQLVHFCAALGKEKHYSWEKEARMLRFYRSNCKDIKSGNRSDGSSVKYVTQNIEDIFKILIIAPGTP